jgi:CheY-like chemotaxis protein
MSYPRAVRILIIEDEPEVTSNYEKLLKGLESQFGACEFDLACSREDGQRRINGDCIYHLLILDLGLPPTTRGQVASGVEPGIALLRAAAVRDSYPIPAALVISGRLGGSTSLPQLAALLEDSFFYGQFINKGDVGIANLITDAIKAALQYIDVGLHLRDGGRNLYPVITPKEDDLLRRCALNLKCVGLDLEWWGAEQAYTVAEGTKIPWKKVLLGEFLLGDNMGRSRPHFFKFEPGESAELATMSARILSKKLPHIKVAYSGTGSGRGLLVTESVSQLRPIGLDAFLRLDSKIALAAMSKLIGEVIHQLETLGETTEKQIAVNSLLWVHHSEATIREGISLAAPADNPSLSSFILETFTLLKDNRKFIWAKLKQCNHGDLHVRNVAVDMSLDAISAFIFDAGAMKSGVNVRDLAQLEVSILLFQTTGNESLVDHCLPLYIKNVEPPADLNMEAGSSLARNTLAILAELRVRVCAMCDPVVYAIALFDQLLIQVGASHLSRLATR